MHEYNVYEKSFDSQCIISSSSMNKMSEIFANIVFQKPQRLPNSPLTHSVIVKEYLSLATKDFLASSKK